MSFVYISYNPADSDFARVLRSRLESEGYNTWMDELREPDETRLVILRNAIASAAAVVVANPRSTAYSDVVWWEINCAQISDTPVFTVNADADIPRLFDQLAAQVRKQVDYVTLPNPMSTDEILALQHIEPEQEEGVRWLVVLLVIVVVVGIVGVGLWLTQPFAVPPNRDTNISTPARLESPEPLPSPTDEPFAGAAVTDEVVEPSLTPMPTDTPVPTDTNVPTDTPVLTDTNAPTDQPAPTDTNAPTIAPSPTPRPSATASWTPSHTATVTPSASPTASATFTHTATVTPSASPTASATRTPRASWVTNTPAYSL